MHFTDFEYSHTAAVEVLFIIILIAQNHNFTVVACYIIHRVLSTISHN